MLNRRMLVKVVAFAWGILLGSVGAAQAEWTCVSAGLPESDVRWAIVDVRDPRVIYASSEKSLYKTADGGQRWKRILGSRSKKDTIRCLAVDRTDSRHVLAGTSAGIKESHDGGKTWELVDADLGGRSKDILEIAQDLTDSERYWLGTNAGLWLWERENDSALKMSAIPEMPVYSIAQDPFSGAVYCVTDKGVWKSSDGGVRWRRALSRLRAGEDDSMVPAQQMGVEEISSRPHLSNMVIQPKSGGFVAAASTGLLRVAEASEENVDLSPPPSLHTQIRCLAASTQLLYALTDHGVLQWDPKKNIFLQMTPGLPTASVSKIVYDPGSDSLYAATQQGLYRWSHPQIQFMPVPLDSGMSPKRMAVEDVERLFSEEPTIRQVQEAAIRYAEVHPDKIKEWRSAAAKKALLPNVSLHRSINRNENVDLDRGGTTDPDRFIQGPVENTYTQYVGVSWDLGDLIWNDDQTTIDTRSKLMVELRDDILTEVTHLYFERRRLQVDRTLSPGRDITLEMEKKLKIDELTAGLDGLTGGYFSAELKKDD